VVPTALASGTVDGRHVVLAEFMLATVLPTLGPGDEVVVVLDAVAPAEAADSFRHAVADDERVRVVEADGPFSFPDRVNRGVAASRGAVVVLLNDDTEVLATDWLDRMVTTASVGGVGAVGATLLYEDGTLQHAGVTTTERLPTHAWYGWDPDDPVDGGVLVDDRPAWAVTAACLAVSREHWDHVGGFSERFPVNYNDIDFCLKLAEEGLVNVVLGSVRLRHFETRTRPRELASAEVVAMHRRWWHRLGPDPLTAGTSALVDRRAHGHG
jgi:GT2 family glycosyltransferase